MSGVITTNLERKAFTLEYSCANLLYFVCRSVTLAIVGGNLPVDVK